MRFQEWNGKSYRQASDTLTRANKMQNIMTNKQTGHAEMNNNATATYSILTDLANGESLSAKQIYDRNQLINSRQDANKTLWEMRQRGYVESAPATGDISDPSARLVWTITEAGRAYLLGTTVSEDEDTSNDAPVESRQAKAKVKPAAKTCQCGGACSRHGNTSGAKYLRDIKLVDGRVDVYAVLAAFGVTCPARQHAIKKLLCAGLRGKGDEAQDLAEARDAVDRAIQMQKE